MCFSAEASFAGGVIISAIGVAVVTKVHKPSQLLFASIPLFFGLQQFTEGVLWLTIPNPEYAGIQKIATYLFLVMADVLWPTLIPLSILMMESNARKRKIMRLLLIAGLSVSIYYTFCLLFLNVTPQIMGYHIKYNSDFSKVIAIPAFIIYLVATHNASLYFKYSTNTYDGNSDVFFMPGYCNIFYAISNISLVLFCSLNKRGNLLDT